MHFSRSSEAGHVSGDAEGSDGGFGVSGQKGGALSPARGVSERKCFLSENYMIAKREDMSFFLVFSHSVGGLENIISYGERAGVVITQDVIVLIVSRRPYSVGG